MDDKISHKDKNYYSNLGNDLRSLISPEAVKILDVGCGHGLIGKKLKEDRSVEVIGIELSESAAEEARKNIDAVYMGNIEKMDLPFREEYFDCIILGDVLEHLVDPWSVINKIKPYLSKDGCIVLSIPNVGHWSVIKNLLAGIWEYKDEGLMDVAHLRFFTLSSIKKCFERSGLTVTDTSYRLSCNKLFKKINKISGGRLTHLLAWQYLVVARKK